MLLIALLIGAGVWIAKKSPASAGSEATPAGGSWVYGKAGERTWVPDANVGAIIGGSFKGDAAAKATAAPRIPDGQSFRGDMSTATVPLGSLGLIPRTPPNTLFTLGVIPRAAVDTSAALTTGTILTASSIRKLR